MKQTNQAIKFLIAQYRAIFRNANIAMMTALATAAATMAVVSAPAQAVTWSDLANQELDGTTKLEDSGNGIVTQPNGAFNVTIKADGGHVLKSKNTGDAAIFKEKEASTFIINGDGATLTIGDGTDKGATVEITNFNVTKGTLAIKGNNDTQSTLKGINIVVGTAPAGADTPSTTATATAVVELSKNGVIGDKDKTTSFAIYSDGELKFSGASTKAAAKNGIRLEGGAITVAGQASGTIDGKLNMIDGSVTVSSGATATTLTVTDTVTVDSGSLTVQKHTSDAGGKLVLQKGITMNGGTLDVQDGGGPNKSGKLEVTGNAVFNEGSKFIIGQNSGITFNGNVSFGAGTLDESNKGTINLGTIGGATGSIRNAELSVAAVDFDKLFKNEAKVAAEGSSDSGGTLTIKVNGTEKIDLVTSGLYAEASGKIDTTGGLAITTEATKVDLDLIAENASFLADKIENSDIGNVELKVGKLAVGKTAADFEIKGDKTIVTVSKSLEHTKGAEQGLKVTSGGTLILLADGSGSITAKGITLDVNGGTTGGNLKIGGQWDVPSLTLTKGTAELTNANVSLKTGAELVTKTGNGTLSLDNATFTAKDGKLKLEGETVSIEGGSKFSAKAAQMYTVTGSGDAATVALTNGTDNKLATKSFKSTDGSGILEILDAGEVNEKLAAKIKEKLDYNGFIQFGGTSKPIAAEEGVLQQGTAGDLSTVGMHDKNQLALDSSSTVASNTAVGNIKLNGADKFVTAKAPLILSNADAAGGKGMFVQNSSGTDVGGVLLSGGSTSLTLNGNGKIGAITVDTANNGSLVIGSAAGEKESHVEVKGVIGGDQAVGKLLIGDNGSLTVTAAEGSGSIAANSLTVSDKASLTAVGQSITVGSGADRADALVAKIDGDITAKSLTLNGAGVHTIAGDANVDISSLSLDATGVLAVGNAEVKSGGSASVFADSMAIKGTLFIDPQYGVKHTTVVVDNFEGSTGNGDAGVVSGTVVVGQNALLAVGFSKDEIADAEALVKPYLDPATGSFSSGSEASDVGNALVLNKGIKVADGKNIVVNKNATIDLTTGAISPSVTGTNNFDLGAQSVLVITDNAFLDGQGKKTNAAIQFEGASGKFNGQGGKIVLAGQFSAADNALQIASGSGFTVTGTTQVTSLNGLLSGELSATKTTVDLNIVDAEVDKSFRQISAPVRELLVGTLRGDYDGAKGLGAELVSSAATTDRDGYAVDAAAHAATYAGAQQAAVASVTTMADAMFGRVGSVGVEAASISATGSQANGGVWLTPMYKSVDADGFNAEGASYGADVDVAGVAFGTDTVNGNMRFGAVFNIGSGESDGKGMGNGLKDEFDYYGFGIYSAMGFGNLAIVGDASMTVISHEVEGLGLRGKADTTAVTMGVTGQYTIATPAVDVTPHLGARFIRLDTDSYDLKSEDGIVATTDFDVQNVFSIPLGVTMSKAFVAGGWSLAPSADLTITFNTGDTEAKSTTQFSGLPSIGLNTEVLDEVTYGLTVGLGAQYGAFGTSFGINYTGSENTDSFGVNAQARYMF